MGPTRKSRSVNKQFSYINDVSPSKEPSLKRNVQRKKKAYDMLGPQWSKEELERFYDAYRKFGKDWKKVAAVVRNRSVEMVEALYTMNRAYLSLPEGTASVVGLIAMMTDHYCNLVGSDSEQESNDGVGTSRRPQKRARGNVRPSSSKVSDFLSHSQMLSSGYGCPSLLKKRRTGVSRPRAVGKRTPRFPVSHTYENLDKEKYFSPIRRGLKLKPDANDDQVAHEIALALAEASQMGGSPQVSQIPNRRKGIVLPSPARNAGRMHAVTGAKPGDSDMDEDDLEGSVEADNGDFPVDKSYLKETELGSMFQKKRRFFGKNMADDAGNEELDDSKEACSGTEEEQKRGASRAKSGFALIDAKVPRSRSRGLRKKSKKVLFSTDESFAADALTSLADLSLMMPTMTNENETTMQVKEENTDLVGESRYLDAIPANHRRDKRKSSGVKAKGNQSMSRSQVATSKTSKSGKGSALDVSATSDAPQESNQCITKPLSKMQKNLASKIPKAEPHSDTHLNESHEAEARDAERQLMCKGKRSSQNASPKSIKHQERSSSSIDLRREGSDSALSAVQVPITNEVDLPTKGWSRRKIKLTQQQTLKDSKFSDRTVKDQPHEKLSNCLSNHRLRRWCMFEWFYSAIDYPWFSKKEFVEYLNHVGLGHVPRLTRVEWGVIRSSLGKPRRFSEQFLKEEKEKLNQYRSSVRTLYAEFRSGMRDTLPADLARPLSVGQRVTAVHPRTREIHDGSVLTVNHTRCRVQFDRPDLGVEFVKDIDCMPLNPLENTPSSLLRHNMAVDKFFDNFNELKKMEQTKDHRPEGYMKFPGENLDNINGRSHFSPSTYTMNNLLKQAKMAPHADLQAKVGSKGTTTSEQTPYYQTSTLAQVHAKEADIEALAKLTRALDKKEAVVLELGRMNDDIFENRKEGDCSLKESEPFKKQYAAVLVQLSEVNEQVASALYCLRQRNTYQGDSLLAWSRSMANMGDPSSILSSFDDSAAHIQESGSHVGEIVDSSRMKAKMMVDAAVQAFSSLKGRGNTIEKIEEAIDYVNGRLPFDDPSIPVAGFHSTDHSTPTTLNLSQAADPKFYGRDKNEAQIPSELIAHCVATLLMIQKCTERQFPPADVARILDSAVTSLQPCCSQNLPVYTEIQKCMGIIKNQILALVPT